MRRESSQDFQNFQSMSKNSLVLSDVAHLKGGFAFKSSDYTDSGRFVLRTINISSDGRISRAGATYISEKLANKFSNFELEDGDTLFVMVGATLGKVGLVTSRDLPALLNQNMWVIRSKDRLKTSPRFLNYWFGYTTKTTLRWASGSARGFVTRDDYRNLPFPTISYSHQNSIVEVLEKIDAKIELNHRINAELEGMAKLLYDYWFVQFDFPMSAAQAAAHGKPRLAGQPYQSSGGKMTYHPDLKREIPAGWQADNILQIADLGGGGTPNTKNPEFWNGHIPFFTPTDAEPQVFKIDTVERITLKGLEGSSTRVYPKGTLFITARGSVGKIMIIASEMAMNQSCYALSPHEGVNTPFLYFHALSLVNFLRTKSSGSIFKSIVTSDVKFSTTVIPDKETISNYGKIVSPLFEQILNNQQQNQHLTALRDWLLPMLMNGQVTVK